MACWGATVFPEMNPECEEEDILNLAMESVLHQNIAMESVLHQWVGRGTMPERAMTQRGTSVLEEEVLPGEGCIIKPLLATQC